MLNWLATWKHHMTVCRFLPCCYAYMCCRQHWELIAYLRAVWNLQSHFLISSFRSHAPLLFFSLPICLLTLTRRTRDKRLIPLISCLCGLQLFIFKVPRSFAGLYGCELSCFSPCMFTTSCSARRVPLSSKWLLKISYFWCKPASAAAFRILLDSSRSPPAKSCVKSGVRPALMDASDTQLLV